MSTQDVVDALKGSQAAIFVGAGASRSAGYPSWEELLAPLATKLGIPPPYGDNLLQIPQYYENRFGQRDLLAKVSELFERKKSIPSATYSYLAQMPTTRFYTTNFDDCLDEALKHHDVKFTAMDSDDAFKRLVNSPHVQVRKIHGSLGNANIVLTREAFARTSSERRELLAALESDLISRTFLFVGYSLRDPHFNFIYDDVLLRMGKVNTHYLALIQDPGTLAIEDFRKRGLEPVPLWTEYASVPPEERLDSFLKDVVAGASETFHIRRYYGDLRRDDEITVIVASHTNPKERYAYFPACDIDVANQVRSDLGKLDVKIRLMSDKDAVADFDNVVRSSFVSICSPFGNEFADLLFKKLSSAGKYAQFVPDGDGRKIVTTAGEFQTNDPSTGTGVRIERALIARYKNPWSDQKFAYVFAGAYALGTHAISKFIAQPDGYQRISEAPPGEEVEFVLGVRFAHWAPYNWECDIDSVQRTLN